MFHIGSGVPALVIGLCVFEENELHSEIPGKVKHCEALLSETCTWTRALQECVHWVICVLLSSERLLTSADSNVNSAHGIS